MNFDPNFDALVKRKVGRRIAEYLASHGKAATDSVVSDVFVDDLEEEYDTSIGLAEVLHVVSLLKKQGWVKSGWINLTPDQNTQYLDQALALTPVGAANHRKGLI